MLTTTTIRPHRDEDDDDELLLETLGGVLYRFDTAALTQLLACGTPRKVAALLGTLPQAGVRYHARGGRDH